MDAELEKASAELKAVRDELVSTQSELAQHWSAERNAESFEVECQTDVEEALRQFSCSVECQTEVESLDAGTLTTPEPRPASVDCLTDTTFGAERVNSKTMTSPELFSRSAECQTEVVASARMVDVGTVTVGEQFSSSAACQTDTTFKMDSEVMTSPEQFLTSAECLTDAETAVMVDCETSTSPRQCSFAECQTDASDVARPTESRCCQTDELGDDDDTTELRQLLDRVAEERDEVIADIFFRVVSRYQYRSW